MAEEGCDYLEGGAGNDRYQVAAGGVTFSGDSASQRFTTYDFRLMVSHRHSAYIAVSIDRAAAASADTRARRQ
jgi:hypothetical protein